MPRPTPIAWATTLTRSGARTATTTTTISAANAIFFHALTLWALRLRRATRKITRERRR